MLGWFMLLDLTVLELRPVENSIAQSEPKWEIGEGSRVW